MLIGVSAKKTEPVSLEYILIEKYRTKIVSFNSMVVSKFKYQHNFGKSSNQILRGFVDSIFLAFLDQTLNLILVSFHSYTYSIIYLSVNVLGSSSRPAQLQIS